VTPSLLASGPRSVTVPKTNAARPSAAPTTGAPGAPQPPALKAEVVEILARMLVANLKRKRGLGGATVVAGSGSNRGLDATPAGVRITAPTAAPSRGRGVAGALPEGAQKVSR
jgi:hypothetical protein